MLTLAWHHRDSIAMAMDGSWELEATLIACVMRDMRDQMVIGFLA
tara:strand:- start:2586 stop:2720 length:135 start_codon:yes stop_codon:yes gene_type:complete